MTQRDEIARKLLYATSMFGSSAEIAANMDHELVRSAYYVADRMIAHGMTVDGELTQEVKP